MKRKRKKIQIKKRLEKLESDIEELQKKVNKDFKNNYYLLPWNFFYLPYLKNKRKKVLIPHNIHDFWFLLLIQLVVLLNFWYRERIFTIITRIKCIKK